MHSIDADELDDEESEEEQERIRRLEVCGSIASFSILLLLIGATAHYIYVHHAQALKAGAKAQAAQSMPKPNSKQFRVEVVHHSRGKQTMGSPRRVVSTVKQAHSAGLLHKGVWVFVFNKEEGLLMQRHDKSAPFCRGKWSVATVHQGPLERAGTAAARLLKVDLNWTAGHLDFSVIRPPQHLHEHFKNGKQEHQLTAQLAYLDAQHAAPALGANIQAASPPNHEERHIDRLKFVRLAEVFHWLQSTPSKFCGPAFVRGIRRSLALVCSKHPQVSQFHACQAPLHAVGGRGHPPHLARPVASTRVVAKTLSHKRVIVAGKRHRPARHSAVGAAVVSAPAKAPKLDGLSQTADQHVVPAQPVHVAASSAVGKTEHASAAKPTLAHTASAKPPPTTVRKLKGRRGAPLVRPSAAVVVAPHSLGPQISQQAVAAPSAGPLMAKSRVLHPAVKAPVVNKVALQANK